MILTDLTENKTVQILSKPQNHEKCDLQFSLLLLPALLWPSKISRSIHSQNLHIQGCSRKRSDATREPSPRMTTATSRARSIKIWIVKQKWIKSGASLCQMELKLTLLISNLPISLSSSPRKHKALSVIDQTNCQECVKDDPLPRSRC